MTSVRVASNITCLIHLAVPWSHNMTLQFLSPCIIGGAGSSNFTLGEKVFRGVVFGELSPCLDFGAAHYRSIVKPVGYLLQDDTTLICYHLFICAVVPTGCTCRQFQSDDLT
jgi:hypothetical protein